jgi:glycopeptide antibiotics resistance protein
MKNKKRECDRMITPLDSTIKGVMEFTWPMIIICILTLSSIRITDIIKNKKKVLLYQEIFLLFFLIYILCLFQIVTFEDQSLYINNNNLVPFREILRYKIGSRLFIKNVIGNVVMFIPYGIFASLYAKLDKPFHAFCLVFFASVTVETTQLMIGRVFDIDDIILNVIGGMLGYFIYSSINKVGESLPKVFRSNWFLNCASILLLGAFVLYIWMVMVR